ncbi:hypothetical protein DFH28DRAFT_939962 [Melampsora americana]|nr:hypothetical protein DFH28DRAFT_939962 [Melampsora americana]
MSVSKRHVGSTKYFCNECRIDFSKRSESDDHRRTHHQAIVSVAVINGDKVSVQRGGNNMFACPVDGCTFEVQNSRYLGPHSKGCLGVARPVVPPVQDRVQGTAMIVPHGADIKGVFCISATTVFAASEVHSHLKNVHRQASHCKDQVKEELGAYASLMTTGRHPPGYIIGSPSEPIQGLKIYNGFTCIFCQKSWRSMKSVVNHFAHCHKAFSRAEARRPHIQSDKCQCLYGHRHKQWFPVLPYVRHSAITSDTTMRSQSPPPESLDHTASVKKLVDKLTKHAAKETEILESDLDKDSANWLFVTGIKTYIKSLTDNGKSVDELVIVGEGDTNVETMVPYIASWIDATMKRLHQTGQLLKRLVLAETSEMVDNKGLMPLQEKTSVVNYARIIATFMWYLISQAEKPVDDKLVLYTVHKNQILALRNLISTTEPRVVDRGGPEEIDLTDVATNDISKQVSLILCSLFQTYCGAWAKQYQYPPMQFLALSTLKDDGSYHDGNVLTHLISALQYATRLAFAEEYLDQPRDKFNPDSDPTVPVEDNWKKFDFLRNNGPGPFTVDAFGDHCGIRETLVVSNKRVTIGGIRNCIHIQDKLAHGDFNKLIAGCKMPKYDVALYLDDPSCKKPGTNFLYHSEMTHKKYGLHMLKEWVRRRDVHGLLDDTWKGGLDDDVSIYDKRIWKESAMWEWLELTTTTGNGGSIHTIGQHKGGESKCVPASWCFCYPNVVPQEQEYQW